MRAVTDLLIQFECIILGKSDIYINSYSRRLRRTFCRRSEHSSLHVRETDRRCRRSHLCRTAADRPERVYFPGIRARRIRTRRSPRRKDRDFRIRTFFRNCLRHQFCRRRHAHYFRLRRNSAYRRALRSRYVRENRRYDPVRNPRFRRCPM